MARFFLDQKGLPSDRNITISDDDAAHIARVLRLRPGRRSRWL